MKVRSNDTLIKRLRPFSKELPGTPALFALFFVGSIVVGVVSYALLFFGTPRGVLPLITINGVLIGFMGVFLPALLTIIIIKSFRRYVKTKHLLFISMIGVFAYSLSLVLGSAIFRITGSLAIADIVVLVGDASIFGWWLLISKVVFGQKKKAVLYPLVQPTLNIVLYIPVSNMLFVAQAPLGLLLIKLYAGIFVFLIISYLILYIFDNPMKKNLGFGSIDAFTQFVQSWLFDIDAGYYNPFGRAFGVEKEINTDTIIFKRKDNSIKAVLFAPWIHYGPVGTIGGSNFPYLLERYAHNRYGSTLFALHPPLNEDCNPVSSSQFGQIKGALDYAIRESKKITNGRDKISFLKAASGDSRVADISINDVNLATFSRAPRVTEDIAPDVGMVFRRMLEKGGRRSFLVDAHNSRYETAPEGELEGVKTGTRYMDEYISAIKSLGKKGVHKSGKLMVGVSSVELYEKLGRPADLANGNLNVMVFAINGFKYAIILFNANNMLPQFRGAMLKHIRNKFKIEAEVCTTDTHFVNSLERNASNVLGRHTKFSSVEPLLDKAIERALSDIEAADAYYIRGSVKKFLVWGPNIRERVLSVVNSVLTLAKVLVPAILVTGFVIAGYIISLV